MDSILPNLVDKKTGLLRRFSFTTIMIDGFCVKTSLEKFKLDDPKFQPIKCLPKISVKDWKFSYYEIFKIIVFQYLESETECFAFISFASKIRLHKQGGVMTAVLAGQNLVKIATIRFLVRLKKNINSSNKNPYHNYYLSFPSKMI